MSTRTAGMLVFIIAGAIFATIAYWIVHPEAYPFAFSTKGIGGAIIIATPGVIAMKGLIEAVTGRPFYELEVVWASLRAWQRGILGLLIVIVGSLLMFAVIIFFYQ